MRLSFTFPEFLATKKASSDIADDIGFDHDDCPDMKGFIYLGGLYIEELTPEARIAEEIRNPHINATHVVILYDAEVAGDLATLEALLFAFAVDEGYDRACIEVAA